PSALRLSVLLATAHSSIYQPLALSYTFGRVRRAEWSVPRDCGLPHVPDDLHSTRPRVPSQPPGSLRGSRQAPKGALGCCEEGTTLLVQYVGHGARPWRAGSSCPHWSRRRLLGGRLSYTAVVTGLHLQP
ncbi:unnamed protein product, partial [Closterium sp. NIES-53]